MKPNINLFGSLDITVQGQSINFTRRKSKAVLAYLLLNSRQHSREKLAALFWGDAAKSDGLRSLRVSLAELRAKLGSHVILVEQGKVCIHPAFEAQVETQAFDALSKWSPSEGLRPLEKVISIYRGELLEDLSDDWVMPLREHYHTLFVAALLKGAEYCYAQNNHAQAIEFAQKVLSIESINERAHQILISCHLAQNNVETALRQYDALRRILLEELGEKPSPATEKLRESILRQIAHSPPVYLTNLPQPSTSFIGRKIEIEKLSSMLLNHAHTPLLVTLTGTGGVGKSRIAIETARKLLHHYTDGAWWVELSPVENAAGVEQTIASVLGAKEKAGQTLRESILQRLKTKKALLILDNCEHLLSECASLFASFYRECAQLHVLATSREPLSAVHERIIPIPPLPLPNGKGKTAHEQTGNEAVKLFMERLVNRQPHFRLSRENAALIAEICQRLDGIPLAIELAAAQTQTAGLKKIYQSLHKPIGQKNAPAHAKRHDSLSNMVAWSYNLLNDTEKSLLRRLSVFADHWTEEQAIIVAGGYEDASTMLRPDSAHSSSLPVSARAVVQAALNSLAAKSLIVVHREGEEPRYAMLDTIRQFAKRALIQSKERNVFQARQSDYFLGMAARLWKQAYTVEEKNALDIMETEHANLRSALAFAVKNQHTRWESDCIDMLGRFWLIRSSATEGRTWLEQILRHPNLKKASRERGVALLQAGLIALNQNDQQAAARYFTEARKIFKRVGDTLSLSNTLNNYGNVFFYQENYKKARIYYEQSLALARKTGNLRAMGFALNNLALTMDSLNEKDQARRLLEEGLELRKKMGDKRGMGIVLNNLGDLAAEANQLGKARQYYIRSLKLRVGMGDERGMLIPLGNLLNIFVLQKRCWQETAMLLGFSDSIAEKTGIHLSPATKAVFNSIRAETMQALGVEFEERYQKGKSLTPNEAASLAERRSCV